MLILASFAAATESADYHAAQARIFVRRGWYDDAEAEVALGLALDPENVDLCGLCVDLGRREADIDRVLACAARGAASSQGSTDARAALSQVESFVRQNYGWIEMRGPDGLRRARVTMESPRILLDAELKRSATLATARAAEGVEFPARLGLPTGDWTVAGQPVRVEAGQIASVTLPAEAFAASAGRGPRFELAIGGVGYAGEALGNLHPGAAMELGARVPAGPLRLGAAFSWEARDYSVENGPDRASPYTFGGALRVGADIDLGGALVLSTDLAAYAVMMPGLELGCEGEPLACRVASPAATEEPVYATGAALAPAVDLGLHYRTGRWLLGMRGTGAWLIGQAPTPGKVIGREGTEDFTVAEPAFGGARVVVAGVVGIGV
ncbi:MAG: hypothetical protein FJ090_18675 [Deltaproteobacteria bacterium]|nr:hypothetical protein [Deltaproteobacteria bacterium]